MLHPAPSQGQTPNLGAGQDSRHYYQQRPRWMREGIGQSSSGPNQTGGSPSPGAQVAD